MHDIWIWRWRRNIQTSYSMTINPICANLIPSSVLFVEVNKLPSCVPVLTMMSAVRWAFHTIIQSQIKWDSPLHTVTSVSRVWRRWILKNCGLCQSAACAAISPNRKKGTCATDVNASQGDYVASHCVGANAETAFVASVTTTNARDAARIWTGIAVTWVTGKTRTGPSACGSFAFLSIGGGLDKPETEWRG